MQTYYGPAWQDTIRDHRAHSVVSHPNSKQDKSKEGEEKAMGADGERREGAPACRKIAERGFDPRTFGL